MIPTVLLAGCLASGIMEQNGGFDSSRFNPADRLSPIKFEQNATMKDTSVHEDPSLMRVGVSRDQITNAFGEPNETSNQDGVVQDVYEFNPDGSKFREAEGVCAQYRRAGVFTGAIATVVHQARIHETEQQLTVYRLRYGPDGTVQSVQKESRDQPQEDSQSATTP